MHGKHLKNIGEIEGKILVFGGAYSNYQALEKLQSIANELAIPSGNIFNTGDAVAYCAEPEECVQLIRDWGIHSISGNVEIQLANDQEDCGCDFTEGGRCDTLSQKWYPYLKNKISPSSISWMKGLPECISFSFHGNRVIVVHGSLNKTSEFIFKSTPWEIKAQNFNQSNADIVLAGHCGLPFNQVNEGKYWLNPGVIGMPANDGTCSGWYLIIDYANGKLSFEHYAFEYNNEKAAQLMESEGLPAAYSKTLLTGIWDNWDILPEAETNQTGIELSL
jgi:predicted phosphodiesterase